MIAPIHALTRTPTGDASYHREYPEIARLIEHLATTSDRADPLPVEDPRHGIDARDLVAALEQDASTPTAAPDALIGAFIRIIAGRPGARRPDQEQAHTNLRWLYRRMADFTRTTLR
ncbi:hypothetical protein C5C31_11665 [Rathayibacter rathayi]|uniref:Uncharacterized protein n=1 Tax=Rathayibacter rathayi TaxID=33887 RepID=A0ABX5AEB0_RATRA|nr:hypothetical protein [Rathayibacter rathayi]PPG66516.1 hypothetical protein C5C02_11205 [Rathayibacter rathayi]PPG74884.1 hypothetical protein C5C23_11780 [Rathayibacter rathayi]PPG87563.1 hypothetical protein C5C47_10315 [Rathayibacter rathayi]PPG95135.1 hypothetical protein C5C00_10985 [Rathayibacter rathayi]PPH20290.1 hypothetical protein C5C31_11665 [Rathayibacter rathayi]